MLHSELLLAFAEIAVAFAGFASLISLLGQSSEVLDSSRLLGIVRTSLLVTAFSLLPFVPAALCVASLAALLSVSGVLFLGVFTSFVRARGGASAGGPA